VILPFPLLIQLHGREYRVPPNVLLTLARLGETIRFPDLGLVLCQDAAGRWWLKGRGGWRQGPFKSAARSIRAVIRRRRRRGRKR
jgi:hypothetical protein